jgi:hypothetical protein
MKDFTMRRMLLTLLFTAAALPALACDDPTCPANLHKNAQGKIEHAGAHGGAHVGHNMADPTGALARNPAVAKYMHDMDAMHKNMAITYTGDADYDFVAGMIPHHQGAVDMAQTVLMYGQDPQVRRLAREIIRSQNLEIKWMQGYMAQLKARGLKPVAADTPPKPKFNETGWLGKTYLYQ